MARWLYKKVIRVRAALGALLLLAVLAACGRTAVPETVVEIPSDVAYAEELAEGREGTGMTMMRGGSGL